MKNTYVKPYMRAILPKHQSMLLVDSNVVHSLNRDGHLNYGGGDESYDDEIRQNERRKELPIGLLDVMKQEYVWDY